MSTQFYHKGALPAMTNEELVSRIQQGERALLSELWANVERFVSQQAGKRARLLQGAGGVEFDDLYNAGYLAMAAAVETYDPAHNMSFIGYLALHLLTTFAEATGYRSTRQRRDPLHQAASLDAPIGTEDGSGTLEDTIADPVDPYEEAETRLWRAQLRAELDRAIDTLPVNQGDALRRKYFQGQSLETISAAAGVSQEMIRQRQSKGLRNLRHPQFTRSLRCFIEAHTDYYMHVGVTRFQTTGSSAVEELAIRREELARDPKAGDS